MAWTALVAEMQREIDRGGYWSGEARVLRDASGMTRLSAKRGKSIIQRLADAGLECDEPEIRYESETLIITRLGGGDLARTLAELLPAIRAADLEVPANATWRDDIVAQTALRGWRGHADLARDPATRETRS